MLNLNHVQEQNQIIVTVSGYITTSEVKSFLVGYKSFIKSIRPRMYNLVIQPSFFDCENESDVKSACMTFLKSGFRKIYLLDEDDHIMSNLKLGPLEKKIFLNSVKVVKNTNEIR